MYCCRLTIHIGVLEHDWIQVTFTSRIKLMQHLLYLDLQSACGWKVCQPTEQVVLTVANGNHKRFGQN